MARPLMNQLTALVEQVSTISQTSYDIITSLRSYPTFLKQADQAGLELGLCTMCSVDCKV